MPTIGAGTGNQGRCLSGNVRIPSTLRGGTALKLNQYNMEYFTAVKTKQIRLNFYGKSYARGILEWKVYKPGKETSITVPGYSEMNLRIYPNPSPGNISIELDTPGRAEIIVWGTTGKQVYRSTFSERITVTNSDTGGAGIFHVRVTCGRRVYYGKIILI